MKLIEEIISDLTGQGGLANALLKTKVLLHQLGQQELVDWVDRELEGYESEDDVPPYRMLNAEVLVDAQSFTHQMKNHHIPLGHLSDEQREGLTTVRFIRSLSVIEGSTDDGGLQAHIPMEFYGHLGQGLAEGWHISSAWSQINSTTLRQLETTIRSRLLTFILNLKQELPEEYELGSNQVLAIDVRSMFDNAVLPDQT